jgi:hypothetical protein
VRGAVRLTALVAATCAQSALAWGNGALPATIQVLLPPGAPKTIVVATTFGLITSADDGATWGWICEHDEGDQGKAYQLAAPPGARILGLATEGLVRSDDLACGWSFLLERSTALPYDYFPDPVDPDRVLALALLRDGMLTSAIIQLTVGAAGMHVLYSAPMGVELNTVEIARANPRIVYATLRTQGGTQSARLARSDDAGGTWTLVTPAPAVPELGIVAIDGADPETLWFRVRTDSGDELQVSRDGGKTLALALAPAGRNMTSFVRLPNGHLLIGWQDVEHGFIDRSTDGGKSFAPLATPLHPRALAERDGKVYAATDAVADEYALAVSADEGTSWTRVMAFADVTAIAACAGPGTAAGAICAASCGTLTTRKVFAPGTCPPDAGAGAVEDAAAREDAGPGGDASGEDRTTDSASPTAAGGSGCSCGVGHVHQPRSLSALLLVAALAARARVRRRRARLG